MATGHLRVRQPAHWAAPLTCPALDTVGTDHVHRPVTPKQGGIWAASPGCPGIDTMLPVLLGEGHHSRGLPLHRIAELTAENSPRIMGLSHAKGMLAVGMDADIALVDINREWKAANDDAVSSAGYTIYDGWTFRGAITHTFVRGRTVVKDGALVEDAVGSGRYVRRSLSA